MNNSFSGDFLDVFFEKFLVEKDALKTTISDRTFFFILDWFQSYDNLSLDEEEKIAKEPDKFFDIFAYRRFFLKFIDDIVSFFKKDQDLLTSLVDSMGLDYSFDDGAYEQDPNYLVFFCDVHCLDNVRYDFESSDFIEIKKSVDNIFFDFRCELIQYFFAKRHDKIWAGVRNEAVQKFDRTAVDLSGSTVVYLDTNVFSRIYDNASLKQSFLETKNKIQYCYSAYVIEDNIKQNIFLKNKVLSVVSEISDNLSVHFSGVWPNQTISYSYEPPKVVYDRVFLWRDTTDAAESMQFYYVLYSKIKYENISSYGFNNFDEKKMIGFLKKCNHLNFLSSKENLCHIKTQDLVESDMKIFFDLILTNYHLDVDISGKNTIQKIKK